MSREPEVVLVAAVAANGVIGRDGTMPWHYPEDLKHFKQLTTGHPVVMGRRTYESIVARIDGPLPDRTNVVLSRSALDLPEGAVHAGGTDEALALAAERDDVVYVVGGETVYEAFMSRADRLVLTELDDAYEGDTYFPELGPEWTETAREAREGLAFVTYER
ncbi:dihydrofolate reductase [Halosegnis marinus]|uniref:dihydrofolate reductase n=1 Tax=Halosegnis marinus TaxID=3034023 RepID=A0ABD5ZS32_9EURY|nr:dihydrofolate reductase [Halosegnis sp. DT85]